MKWLWVLVLPLDGILVLHWLHNPPPHSISSGIMAVKVKWHTMATHWNNAHKTLNDTCQCLNSWTALSTHLQFITIKAPCHPFFLWSNKIHFEVLTMERGKGIVCSIQTEYRHFYGMQWFSVKSCGTVVFFIVTVTKCWGCKSFIKFTYGPRL